jgi:hypothetical protein
VSQQIGDELRTSIKLMPGFAFAHYALANLAVMTEENLKEGLEAASIAIRLEPQNKRFAFALAQLQVQTKDYAAAKKTLEPLLSADVEPRLKESAESTMKLIEDRARPARVEQPLPDPEQNSGPPNVVPESKQNSDPTKSASEPLPGQQAEKAPERVSQPTIKLEGTQTIRGVLVAIECSAGKWTLIVKASANRIRFMVSNKDKLEFFSQDPSFAGAVRCGPVNKTAFIYFKPLAGQAKLAGDAVAVEFTRD